MGVGLAIHLAIVRGSAEGGGRSLQEVGEFSAGWFDLVSRWQPSEPERFVYVGWLLPVLAAAGGVLLWRGGRRALAVVLGAGAVVPLVLALGTNLPLYGWLWEILPPLRFPRVPGRLLPIADLALAALAAVAIGRLIAASGRRAALATAALVAVVAADLLVFPLGASADDPGNEAYAALRAEAPGRTLELPMFEPGIHYGSVYDYYQLQAPRERPGGYSTLVSRVPYNFYFLRNRLSCGVWLPGDVETLEVLGIRFATFHAGMYAQADVPGAWFGWQGLVEHAFSPVARGGQVTLFARGAHGDLGVPVPEPDRERPLFCEGWNGRVMDERQAPLWVHGEGALRLEVKRELGDAGTPLGGRRAGRSGPGGRLRHARGRAGGRPLARGRARDPRAPGHRAARGPPPRPARPRAPMSAGSGPRTRGRPPGPSRTGSATCAAPAGSR